MKRKAYGRDFGLSSRMLLTMFTLGLLYVVFFVVMVNVLNIGIFAIVLIMGGLAFLQYFTSDKIALLASGAKVVGPDEAPGAARDGRAPRGDGRPPEAAGRGDPDGKSRTPSRRAAARSTRSWQSRRASGTGSSPRRSRACSRMS